MGDRTKVLLLIIVAFMVGTIIYNITPPDWTPGTYHIDVAVKTDETEIKTSLEHIIGLSNSTDTTVTTWSIVDGKNYTIEVYASKLTVIEPGKKWYLKVRLLADGEPVHKPLSSYTVCVRTPDGREYSYYPRSMTSDGWVVFEIQPYIKAREAGFVFGSAIILFAGASIISYVITGLYSTVALALLGVIAVKSAFTKYMSTIILVFIAGSALELIIRNNKLDDRVARLLVRVASSPTRLIIGATFLVSFLSMWMSNTAATYVMLPLVLALLKEIQAEDKRFSSLLLVGIAMGASIGGTATLIGTPPNLIVTGFLNDIVYKTSRIGFFEWLLIGFPAWVIGYTVGVLLLILFIKFTAGHELKEIGEKLREIGARKEKRPWSKREILALANILFLVGLWLTEPIHHINTGIAGAIGLIVFFATGVLDVKKHFKQLAWDLMVLFGAGLTLGTALMNTGWAEVVLAHLAGVKSLGFLAWFLIGFTAYLIGTFISSHTSASAFVAPLTIPLGALLATIMGIPAEAGAATASIVAVVSLNNAIALPISTPPSAIVYSTGKVRMRDLIAYGLLFGIIANTLIIALLTNYWIALLSP
ncbi:DASS family sodium-coupled anion symporter [Desulfurococcaceae archaeon MEX13E-LK6-19]|nr:DASS family sodium-coupled anion symporter [Desulfurococcaceae archaeon MEX13E-LK6-19]